MRVNYYDVNRMSDRPRKTRSASVSVLLPELLKTSDIVSLHVPLDKSTCTI